MKLTNALYATRPIAPRRRRRANVHAAVVVLLAALMAGGLALILYGVGVL